MHSHRKKIYADDLVKIIQKFKKDIKDIDEKLCDDTLINKGLFLMANSLFEEAIREFMNVVLTAFPEKLNLKSSTLSKKQICEIADRGYKVIIENELYLLFREGVVSQLEYLIDIISGTKARDIDTNIREMIVRCFDISLYRNALVHNGGKVSKDLYSKAKYYKPTSQNDINFSTMMIKNFIIDYESFFDFIEKKVLEKFSFYEQTTRIQKLKELWYRCFDSPILVFEDYWEVNIENDLVTGVKKFEKEDCLSSGEAVYLSIWRHQYDDRFNTKEFLICSINYSVICDIYNVFTDVKFYYMSQEADRLKH